MRPPGCCFEIHKVGGSYFAPPISLSRAYTHEDSVRVTGGELYSRKGALNNGVCLNDCSLHTATPEFNRGKGLWKGTKQVILRWYISVRFEQEALPSSFLAVHACLSHGQRPRFCATIELLVLRIFQRDETSETQFQNPKLCYPRDLRSAFAG